MSSARVALVGAGPGDPGLLTLRAAELLAQADVVLVDRLVHPDVLAHCREGVEVVDVTGHLDPADPASTVRWEALAQGSGTVVVLMGLDRLRLVAAFLVAAGRPPHTPAACIQDGTTVIGDVVHLRGALRWFDA